MKCTDFENRIELLFDDNTPAEVRREMLEHLETCPACAEFYRQTKAAFNTVAPRVEVQAPAGLKARILKTAAQAENTPATARTTAPARPRQLWLRPLSATLSAAALIAPYCSSSIPSAATGPTPQDVSSAMLPLNSTKAVRSASK